MKWYFAVNENGLLNAWDQIEITVNSARRNTKLDPICLVDHGTKSTIARSRVDFLSRQGIKIIKHQASLWPIVKSIKGIDSDVFSGHWLRCDIPLLDQSDEIVLYTDIDVMFRRDPEPFDEMPEFLACAPEHNKDDWGYFNSGVMLMNLENLRATRQQLVAHVEQNASNMAAHDDQGAFNSVYRGRWDRLDIIYNWKPYWGIRDKASIVHFHGPKPGVIRHYQKQDGDLTRFGEELFKMYQRSPEGYAQYMTEAESYRTFA